MMYLITVGVSLLARTILLESSVAMVEEELGHFAGRRIQAPLTMDFCLVDRTATGDQDPPMRLPTLLQECCLGYGGVVGNDVYGQLSPERHKAPPDYRGAAS